MTTAIMYNNTEDRLCNSRRVLFQHPSPSSCFSFSSPLSFSLAPSSSSPSFFFPFLLPVFVVFVMLGFSPSLLVSLDATDVCLLFADLETTGVSPLDLAALESTEVSPLALVVLETTGASSSVLVALETAGALPLLLIGLERTGVSPFPFFSVVTTAIPPTPPPSFLAAACSSSSVPLPPELVSAVLLFFLGD